MVSGGGGLTVGRTGGGGTVVLSAANTYSGVTTVVAGSVLSISNAGALGGTAGGTSVSAGASLNLSGGITVSEPLTIAGVASNNAIPTGLVSVSGDNTYAGTINATTGSQNVRIAVTAGSLTLAGNIILSGGGNATGLVLNPAAAATLTQTGTISGGGSLIFTIAGATTTLSGTNTFSGKVTIQRGTVRTPSLNSVVGPATASGLGVPASATAGTIDFGNSTDGAALAYTGGGETTDRVINLIGSTGGATLDQAGSGTLTFASNLAVGTNGAKTLTLTGSTAGTGAFNGAIVNSGSGATGVAKTGTGTWTLAGANTYTGTTTLTAGTLILANALALGGNGTVALNGGTLVNATAAAITSGGSGSIGGSFTFGTAASTAANNLTLTGTTAFATDLSRTVTFAGTGTTLALASTFNNNNDNNRTLTVNGPGNTLVLGGIGLNTSTANSRTITISGTANVTVTGPVANGNATAAQGLAYSGTGVLTLNGGNTYTGATTVSGGLVRFNGVGTVVSAVTVNINAALGGTGTIPGAVTAAGGGILDLRSGAVGTLTLGSTLALNGTAAVPNNLYFDLGASTVDTITATGAVTAATAGGALISFNQLPGAPLADSTYTLVTSSAATSNTAGFALATTRSGGRTYTLATAATGNIVQVTVGTAAAGPASAVWSGATSSSWNAAGNWNTDATSNAPTGAVPGVGSNVAFYTTTPAATNLSTVLNADFEINSLTFLATSPVTIAPGTLATSALTIDAGTVNGNTAGNGISQLAAAAHTIFARVGLGAAQTWTVAAGGGLTVSGVVFDISPGFTLTKAGAGTLTLSGTANTFTGDIAVTGGVLAFVGGGANGDPLSLGAGTKTVTVTNNATVRLITASTNPAATNSKRFVVGTGGATFDVGTTAILFTLDDAGQFGGTGDLTVAGTGTVYLNSQAFNFTGNVFVNSGTLRLGTNSVLGTTPGRTITVAAGGALDLSSTATAIPLDVTLNGTGVGGTGALTAATASGTLASDVSLGSDSGIGAAAGFVLTLGGDIDGAFNLAKVGPGTAVLSGTNTYGSATGAATTVTAGTLAVTRTAALPNYATAGRVAVASAATLALNVGGTGEFTAADVTAVLVGGAFASGSVIGFDTTNAGGTFTAPAVAPVPAVAALNLIKFGTGTLTLPSANGFGTGSTTILNGAVVATAGTANPLGTGALVLGTSNGTPGGLDLGTSSQTVGTITVQSNSPTANTIAIGASQRLTATGAVVVGVNSGGTATTNLTVTGATGTFSIGTATTPTNANYLQGANTTDGFSNGTTVDLSGLGTFYANLGTGTFRVGDPTNSGGVSTLNSTLLLAATSTIRVTTLTTDSPDTGRTQTIRLGTAANTINANTIEVGGSASGRSSGVLNFLTATGGLTVRNLAGNGRANLNVAYGATTTGLAPVGTVDLTGHTADLQLGTLQVGGRTGTSGGSSTGTFSFDTGTLDVTAINIAGRSSTTTTTTSVTLTGTSTGTVNLGGGSVTIGATGVRIGVNTSSQTVATNVNPTFGTLSVTGGTVAINGPVTLGGAASANAGQTSRGDLTISGGTVTLTNSITVGGTVPAATTSNLSLGGGTLNMGGNNIGTAAVPLTAVTFTGGTLNNLGTISQPLTQNGATAVMNVTTFFLPAAVTAANATAYTLAAGTLDIADGRTLTATSGTGTPQAAAVVVNGGTTLAIRFGESAAGGITSSGRVTTGGGIDLTAITATNRLNIPLTYTTGFQSDGSTPVTITVASSTSGGIAYNPAVQLGGTVLDPNAFNVTAMNFSFVGNYSLSGSANTLQITFTPSAVPEPATLGLLGAAGLGLAGWARRRRAK